MKPSGAGKEAMITKQTAWAGSDSVLRDSEIMRSEGSLRLVPILASGLALIYYIPDLPSTYELTLSREVIVGMFNGTITSWNDSAILNLNPALQPYINNAAAVTGTADVKLVVRSSGSGSTEVWSKGLASISSEWKAKYGVFSDPKWPVWNFRESTNKRSILRVLRTPFAVSYVEVGQAISYEAPFARIINKAGNNVALTTKSIKAAMTDFANTTVNITNFSKDIVDGSGHDSYPWATFTYLVLRLGWPEDCSVAYELMRFVHWALTDEAAESIAEQNSFTTLSQKDLQQQAFTILRDFKCSNGKQLLAAVEHDVEQEKSDLRGKVFMLGAVVSLVVVVLIGLGLALWWRNLHKSEKEKSRRESLRRSVSNADDSNDEERKQHHRRWLGHVLVALAWFAIEVVTISLDFLAFFTLPQGPTLVLVYLVIISVGLVVVGIGQVCEARSLTFKFMHPEVWTPDDITSRFEFSDPVRLYYRLRLLKNSVVSDAFFLLDVLLREIPIIFVTLLIFQESLSVNVIVILMFGLNAALLGIKLAHVPAYFQLFRRYQQVQFRYRMVKRNIANEKPAGPTPSSPPPVKTAAVEDSAA
ncbi:Phosphate-binding protein PstS 1 [Quaeritorhiza haematococci]|nr:Phosphate-binding protein PstS 1 [Quaeritorhiza haematococci]